MTISGVRIDGDQMTIKMPVDRAHALAVALQPCPCKNTKSAATDATRAGLAKAIMKAVTRGPKS